MGRYPSAGRAGPGRRFGLVVAGVLAGAVLLASCSSGASSSAGPSTTRAPSTTSAPTTSRPQGPSITVMTRNLYFGADLSPLFHDTTADLAADATAAYDQLQASDPPARLEAVANEVAGAKPDLVALQEAVIWSVLAPGAKAATVRYDFVKLLLADLHHLGQSYEVAASSNGFSGGLPVPGVGLVALQDRDVILVKTSEAGMVSQPRAGPYHHVLTVSVAGVPITVKRGWASIDVNMQGRRFRVIATHLEAYSNPTRDAQAAELLSLVKSSSLPTLVLGDVNSPASGAGDATYLMMRRAGLGDAWAAAHPGEPGYSCCRAADLRSGVLNQRIDMIFTRGGFEVLSASLVGVTASDRTPSGLWPSDHAGVVATLVPPG